MRGLKFYVQFFVAMDVSGKKVPSSYQSLKDVCHSLTK